MIRPRQLLAGGFIVGVPAGYPARVGADLLGDSLPLKSGHDRVVVTEPMPIRATR